ncbi:MAG: hypothetical protein QOH01_1314 [Verrucomicrobiota bacterium]
MKVTPPHRVRVIVDPAFGERLAALPADEPSWVLDTPENTLVAHRLWKERPAASHLPGITTFRPGQSLSAEDEFISQLGTIDLHHGHYSADPPYSVLEVIGCSPSDRVRAALEEFAFAVQSTTSDGFIAVRTNET